MFTKKRNESIQRAMEKKTSAHMCVRMCVFVCVCVHVCAFLSYSLSLWRCLFLLGEGDLHPGPTPLKPIESRHAVHTQWHLYTSVLRLLYMTIIPAWIRSDYHTLQCTATNCNAMQCTATRCNTLQHFERRRDFLRSD